MQQLSDLVADQTQEVTAMKAEMAEQNQDHEYGIYFLYAIMIFTSMAYSPLHVCYYK